MIIDLAEASFENDFFFISIPNGGQLVFNIIDESIKQSATTGIEINRVNIQAMLDDGGFTYYNDCPSVIGLGNDIMKLMTDYKEYEGKLLTKDNLRFCKVEVYD